MTLRQFRVIRYIYQGIGISGGAAIRVRSFVLLRSRVSDYADFEDEEND